MMLLNDKNVILTGAGRGIGREIAIKLASEGANLVLISRTEEELKETLKLLKPYNSKNFYIPVDISDESQVFNAFSKIINKFNKIDCLINNAGIQPPIGPFYLTDINQWKTNFKINLFGSVNCTFAIVKVMVEQKYGKIINISGGGSTSPRPNFSAYGVSKTAIVRFTETIAEELREFNIDVNAIAPGAINTKMLDEVLSANKNAGKEYEEAIERKKFGGSDPKIAANLVSYLCSDVSNGITGKLISAPWDPWQNKEFQNLLKNDKNLCTLRRIDNKFFFSKENT